MTSKQVHGRCLVKNSPDLRTAGQRFLISLRASNSYSPAYLASLAVTLGLLSAYAEENDWPGVAGITADHIEEYLIHLQERPKWFGTQGEGNLSQSYIEVQYRRIKRFCNWLTAREHMERNPLDLIKHPRVNERTIPTVSDRDMDKLLALVNPRVAHSSKKQFFCLRNRALLYLLWDTPSRREEIASLIVESVDWDHGAIHVLGKGRKERWMTLSYQTLDVLYEYRDISDAMRSDTEALWVSYAGQPMDAAWVYKMLKRLGKKAQIENLHTHRFRHTYAMNALAAGMQERYLMHEGGWSKIPETYFRRLGPEHIAERHRELSPVARLGRLEKKEVKRTRKTQGETMSGPTCRW